MFKFDDNFSIRAWEQQRTDHIFEYLSNLCSLQYSLPIDELFSNITITHKYLESFGKFVKIKTDNTAPFTVDFLIIPFHIDDYGLGECVDAAKKFQSHYTQMSGNIPYIEHSAGSILQEELGNSFAQCYILFFSNNSFDSGEKFFVDNLNQFNKLRAFQ